MLLVALVAFAQNLRRDLRRDALVFADFHQLVEAVGAALVPVFGIERVILGAQVPLFRLGCQKRAVRAADAKYDIRNFFLQYNNCRTDANGGTAGEP